MKTKQTYMRAVLPATGISGAKNMGNDKEQTAYIKLIDKKTERTIIDARWYMARSKSAQSVYCSIWFRAGNSGLETSGHGVASGWGYHKSSASAASAIRNAGIELYGSPYGHPVNSDTPAQTKKLLQQPAHIGGCGSGSVECALSAIAYAMGFKDCITVRG